MVDEENLDIRTITMGISLKSCAGPDVDTVCEKVYEKITTYAKDLVKPVRTLRLNSVFRLSTREFR